MTAPAVVVSVEGWVSLRSPAGPTEKTPAGGELACAECGEMGLVREGVHIGPWTCPLCLANERMCAECGETLQRDSPNKTCHACLIRLGLVVDSACENCGLSFSTRPSKPSTWCPNCRAVGALCRGGNHWFMPSSPRMRRYIRFCPEHEPPPRECAWCPKGLIPYGQDWEDGHKTCARCRTKKGKRSVAQRHLESTIRRAKRIADATTADPITPAQLAAIRAQQCVYCGSPGAHADHIRPLYRGGHHRLENLVAACKACNGFKATLTLLELAEERPDLVAHACLVSPLVLAEYAREKLGGTLNGPELTPIQTTLTSDKPNKRYAYTRPPTPDLVHALALSSA